MPHSEISAADMNRPQGPPTLRPTFPTGYPPVATMKAPLQPAPYEGFAVEARRAGKDLAGGVSPRSSELGDWGPKGRRNCSPLRERRESGGDFTGPAPLGAAQPFALPGLLGPSHLTFPRR